MSSTFRIAPSLLLCMALAACSNTPSSNSRADYEKAVTTAPLEVPPPMQAPVVGPDGVELPVASAGQPSALLPQPSNVRVARDGDMRWLVVNSTVEQLWPRVREFWTKEGFKAGKEDPRLGLLETQWMENRADIPESFVRGLISKVAPKLYGAHTRDRFRTRIERGIESGTAEVYLTHYGVEQISRGESLVWQMRPSDPELVAEMMIRFMQFLGVPDERAKVDVTKVIEQAPRARLDGDHLAVDESFARAWRLTGIALDRTGLVVEDLDRAKGLYYVRESETFVRPEKSGSSGWFSSEKTTQEERRFRILVQGDERASRIGVQDHRGEPTAPDEARLILTRLQEELR